MRRAGSLVLAVAAAASALASCADEDSAPTPSTVPLGGLPGPAGSAPGAAVPTTAVTPAPATAPPGTDDVLGAAMPTSDGVGLPSSWTIRDVDPSATDPEVAALADPLQGQVTCPDGALRPADGWRQRTFSGADPDATGMLRVDVVLAVEDAGAFAARRAALAACTSGEESFVEAGTVAVAPLAGSPLAPAGPDTEAATLTVSVAPSADVPYPSRYSIVTANLDGRTVTAVVGGVDLGVPFDDTTRELVGRVLARS